MPVAPEHREFTVKVEGEPMPREHQLVGVTVSKVANKIAWARLDYLDGAASTGTFALSASGLLVPGNKIEVLAGPGDDAVPLFHGVVVSHSLMVRGQSAPRLTIECRHAATRLAVRRSCRYALDETDADLMRTLAEDAGLTAEIEDTAIVHTQLVQYDCTDWDFLLLRAAANGLIVLTNDERLVISAPNPKGDSKADLTFGATVLELDIALEARGQSAALTGKSWDPAQQALVEVDADDPGVTTPGNLDGASLADALQPPETVLRHAALPESEVQAWADARWLYDQLDRVVGRAKCEGMAAANPGDVVTLAGFGDRFNGPAFVTGVRHQFDLVSGWKTHLQFGGLERRVDPSSEISSPTAAGLLPGIRGLHVGVVTDNEDPAGEHRVRVRMPLISSSDDGTWARVATLDAGAERGTFFRPEVGDEVVLGFLQEDPRQPLLLGMLHSSANAPHLEGSNDNPKKGYRSRSGIQLLFDDEKVAVRLSTPAGNVLELSEADSGLKLEDQNGNSLVMNADGIAIKSATALSIETGTGMTLSGGTDVEVSASANLSLEGSAGTALKSSAVTTIRGSLVTIN